MCLIAYSSKGKMIDRSILAYAYNQNPDGIGVMSLMGIEKFLGRKALKRMRRYIETYIVPENVPFAIHFRWATHGDIGLANTHPYEAPTGAHWIMHNGVINLTTAESSKEESDTAVYVRKFMAGAPPFTDAQYYEQVGKHIGSSNKFCIMNGEGAFKLCNEDSGTWIEDVWYSNTYSLPASKVPVIWSRGYGGGVYNNSHTGYRYISKEIWDYHEHKFVPNPAYKELDATIETVSDVAGRVIVPIGTGTRTQDPYLLPRPRAEENERWNQEDRRSYYEALEAGLSVDTEYYDAGSIGETAAKMVQLNALEKPVADVGGDFAPAEDKEEQSKFRQYLKAVAAGIYSA